MLVWQEKVAVVILVGVIAVLLVSSVALGSIGKEAFSSQYSQDSPEGALVRHQGVVEEISPTRTGGHLLLQVSGVRVFIPASCVKEGFPVKGETVSICGKVQTFQGNREIVVESASDIRAL